MASEDKHSHEFRRYRQVLLALYFAVVAAGGALLVASVLWQLVVSPPATEEPPTDPEAPFDWPISVGDPDPDKLLRCHADISALLKNLGDIAGDLKAAPTRDAAAEIDSLWERRSRQWRSEYEDVGARCRPSSLADAHRGAHGLGPMAEVYAKLPAMLRRYQTLLEQFDDPMAGELAQMRRALDRSRTSLLRGYDATPAP